MRDNVFENDETINLSLSNATGSILGSPSTAVLTIINDDAAPTFVQQTEGNMCGQTAFVFTITKTGNTAFDSLITYSTVNGSATSPGDFTAISGDTLTIFAAQSSGTITVQVNGDTTSEADENFAVNLSNVTNGSISDANGAGTIIDDDFALGSYPNTSVVLSGNAVITATAPPINAASMNVSTDTDFKGTLTANAATGTETVTDAHPAGTYTMTINAFDGGGAVIGIQTFALTVTSGTACGTELLFGNQPDVGAGSSPTSVAIGDFNNDGKQDLAVANLNSNSVSVKLGDGLGGFTNAADVAVGNRPFAIAVGDFNSDGSHEILPAVNGNSNNVSIRLGDGAGGFTNAADVTVGSKPVSLAIGDFNGDGKQDFATANSGASANSVSIRLGDNLGGFSGTTTVAVGNTPFAVAVGDFNADGKQDLVAANSGSTTVSVRLGDGLGGFTNATDVTVGNSPYSVVVGDFNNDGKQDFATANYTSNSVSVRLGDGAGNFTNTTDVAVGSRPKSMAVGDFNLDGKQDLTIANSNSTVLSVRSGGCTTIASRYTQPRSNPVRPSPIRQPLTAANTPLPATASGKGMTDSR